MFRFSTWQLPIVISWTTQMKECYRQLCFTDCNECVGVFRYPWGMKFVARCMNWVARKVWLDRCLRQYAVSQSNKWPARIVWYGIRNGSLKGPNKKKESVRQSLFSSQSRVSITVKYVRYPGRLVFLWQMKLRSVILPKGHANEWMFWMQVNVLRVEYRLKYCNIIVESVVRLQLAASLPSLWLA